MSVKNKNFKGSLPSDLEDLNDYLSSAKQKSNFEIAKTIDKKIRWTEKQLELIKCLDRSIINLVHGPAGTGKSFVTIAHSLKKCLLENKRLVLLRPIFESAVNKLGFLKGDLEEKLFPHKRNFEDILLNLLSKSEYEELLQENKIIYEVLNFSRGITLKNSIIVCDESQNMTLEELVLITTRLSPSSKIIFTGDFYQSDLKAALGSLGKFEELFGDMEEVNIFKFDHTDNHRHPIIQEITKRWEAYKNTLIK